MTTPMSPATISPDTTLAELRTIDEAWQNTAREANIPEKLFTVAYFLGNDIETRYRDGAYRMIAIGDAEIYAIAKITTRDTTRNAWRIVRKVTAFVGTNQVLSWEWLYTADDLDINVPESFALGTGLLYVPGDWSTSALAMYPKAEAARAGMAHAALEAERRSLASRLLVGENV